MACLALPLAAQTTDADLKHLHQQLLDEEQALFKVRLENAYGDCSDVSSWEPEFKSLAETAAAKLNVTAFEMQPLQGSEPIALADGSRSPLAFRRYDLRGRGSFFAVDRLLRDLSILNGDSIDFDTFEVTAQPDGAVEFRSRLAKACWSGVEQKDDVPKTLQGQAYAIAAENARVQFLRAQQAAIREVAARLRAKRLTTALGQLDEEWGDAPVLLSGLRYAEPALTLTGAVVGTAARKSIDTALSKAGLQRVSVDWTGPGPCAGFTAVARLDDGATDEHDPSHEIFDPRSPTQLCAKDASAAVAVTVRGSGDFTLHARRIGVADLFKVINDLIPTESFIVEPAATKMLNVDIDHATFDETIAAVGAAEVHVGPGPLRRVCVGSCGDLTPRNAKYDGEPVTIIVQDALATDVLRTLAKATGLQMDVPRDLQARISIFARNVAWDRLVMGIIEALHLDYVIEEHRMYIASKTDLSKSDHGGTVAIEKFEVAPAPRFMSVWEPEKLAVADLRVGALAQAAGSWKAYVVSLGPDPRLLPLEAGSKLLDGSVESASANGVKLRTGDGQEIQVKLEP